MFRIGVHCVQHRVSIHTSSSQHSCSYARSAARSTERHSHCLCKRTTRPGLTTNNLPPAPGVLAHRTRPPRFTSSPYAASISLSPCLSGPAAAVRCTPSAGLHRPTSHGLPGDRTAHDRQHSRGSSPLHPLHRPTAALHRDA